MLWKARIKLPNGMVQEIKVEATSHQAAKKLIEAQYSGIRVLTGPSPAR